LVVLPAAFLLDSSHLPAFKVDLQGKEEDSHRQDLGAARCVQVLGRSFACKRRFLHAAMTAPKKFQAQLDWGYAALSPIQDYPSMPVP
jgi:hypothetical protein